MFKKSCSKTSDQCSNLQFQRHFICFATFVNVTTTPTMSDWHSYFPAKRLMLRTAVPCLIPLSNVSLELETVFHCNPFFRWQPCSLHSCRGVSPFLSPVSKWQCDHLFYWVSPRPSVCSVDMYGRRPNLLLVPISYLALKHTGTV